MLIESSKVGRRKLEEKHPYLFAASAFFTVSRLLANSKFPLGEEGAGRLIFSGFREKNTAL